MASFAAVAAVVMMQQSGPTPLSPSGKWTVEYADNECRVSRSFGTGTDRLTLAILTTPGKQFPDFIIVQPGRPGGKASGATVSMRPAAMPQIKLLDAAGGPAATGGRITRALMSRDDLARLGTTSVIALTIDGTSMTIPLADFPAVLKAQATCEIDLARSWGLDPQQLARIKTRPSPAGSPVTWLTDDDYPAGPLRRREQGTVTFRLDIDTSGKPVGCAVLKSSGSKELDDTACALLVRRARFNPALDIDGARVPSFFITRFNWRLPG